MAKKLDPEEDKCRILHVKEVGAHIYKGYHWKGYIRWEDERGEIHTVFPPDFSELELERQNLAPYLKNPTPEQLEKGLELLRNMGKRRAPRGVPYIDDGRTEPLYIHAEGNYIANTLSIDFLHSVASSPFSSSNFELLAKRIIKSFRSAVRALFIFVAS